MDLWLFINIWWITVTNQQLSYNLFSSFFIHKKVPSVNHNKLLWKMHWKPWQMRITDESETKTCESYSISWLFLVSSSQQKSFEFIIQLLVIISNFIITITMLLKCIQSLHERPSFGIAHYTVIIAMNLFKVWQLALSQSYIQDSRAHIANILWAFNWNHVTFHDLPKINISWKAVSLLLMDSRCHNLVRM